MFDSAAVLAGAFAQHLVDDFHLVYGKREPDHGATIRAIAQLAVERISSSDALYHDVHHTMMVTLVGQTILRGRIMVEEVTARGLAAFHGGHALPRSRLPARRLPGRSGRPLRHRRRRQHGRSAARRLGRVPRPLPYRAQQDLRPPPLQDDQAPGRRADRAGDRAHPLPDSRRARLCRDRQRAGAWCAPPT